MQKKNARKNKIGFTLVEVLVVVGIIALAATIITASLRNARVKSRDARRLQDLASVRSALELYLANNGSYPAGSNLSVLRTGGFISALPLDPLGGGGSCAENYNGAPIGGGGFNCYGYAYNAASSPQRYHLWAELEERDPALDKDGDGDSTGWNGAAVEGGDEFDCADDTPNDCVYDLGGE